MNRRSRGVSLIEVLIASGIGAVVLGGGAMLYKSASRQTQVNQEDQSSKIEVDRVFGIIGKRLYNSIFLIPAEGLDMPDNAVYRGVFGLRAQLTGCKYEMDFDQIHDKYSILRYTSILNQFAAENTLAAWDESGMPALRLSVSPRGTVPVGIFQESKKNVSEIVLIDADTTDIHRYGVVSVDPDTTRQVIPVDHNMVKLEPAKTLTLNSVKNLKKKFITDSIAYGTETRILCVNSEGNLVEKSETTGKTEVLLDPRPTKAVMEKFEVKFWGSKYKERLDFSKFIPFPSDIPTQECLNTVLLSITLKQGTLSKSFEKLVLINNFNSRRSLNCG